MSTFEVPSVARTVIGEIVTAEEVLLVAALPTREFSADEAREALQRVTDAVEWPQQRVEQLLESAYRRGALDLVDESFTRFKVATFYDRLGVFVIGEPARYLAFPAEARAALDSWYLDAYAAHLSDDERPTEDLVLGLAETLAHIDATDQQIWLGPCDCRTLAGACDKPVLTCVSFRNGINTLSHRGWQQPLTKDEAKAVVREADADGLMHTANPRGICNCCSDCCYLFRAQAARGSGPAAWPLAEKIARFDAEECIACGRCIERCPFDAFEWSHADVVFHAERCRGCGLCFETCPTDAIELGARVSGA